MSKNLTLGEGFRLDGVRNIRDTCRRNLARAREQRDKAEAQVANCMKSLEYWEKQLRELEDDGA